MCQFGNLTISQLLLFLVIELPDYLNVHRDNVSLSNCRIIKLSN